MTAHPRVVIVILNWNGKEDTAECIDSLSVITYPNFAIVIVDNASADGSVEFFKARNPSIEIAQNSTNIGFGAGNNVGIALALNMGADYVLLLNNDTVVDRQFLDYLVREAESDSCIGFVGPKIYRLYEGEATEYAVWRTFRWKKMRLDATQKTTILHSAGGSFNPWLGKLRHRGAAEFDAGQYDERKQVDFVEGSCVLVKKDAINSIGVLDPTYFAYVEDVDWCLRGQNAGYKTIYVPQAKIWHKASKSSVDQTRVYYGTRNRFWLMQKRTTKLQYVVFLLSFLLINAPLTIIIDAAYQRGAGTLRSFIMGIAHGLWKAPVPQS
jgi:GT2 family glycosyltransferase